MLTQWNVDEFIDAEVWRRTRVNCRELTDSDLEACKAEALRQRFFPQYGGVLD